MFLADDWLDYQVLDAGGGEKWERWGPVQVIRPDPQIIWPCKEAFGAANLHYHRSASGGGYWESLKKTPPQWNIQWNTGEANLQFLIRPTDFKHMGLFPEQAANWKWAMELLKTHKSAKPRVLNLFGYTGGATVACLRAGAQVTHVDAAKGMNQWAKENIRLNQLESERLRLYTDDVYKFVLREQRRGNQYDAVIMDPPSYGRGPTGEVWKLEERLFPLVQHCAALLTSKPLFFLINIYTAGLSCTVLENILALNLPKGKLTSGPLGLPIGKSANITKNGLVLPCGIGARWEGL